MGLLLIVSESDTITYARESGPLAVGQSDGRLRGRQTEDASKKDDALILRFLNSGEYYLLDEADTQNHDVCASDNINSGLVTRDSKFLTFENWFGNFNCLQ